MDPSMPAEKKLGIYASEDISIPGTVFLVDARNLLRGKHSRNEGDIVLVPAPSDHPDDPLNWAPKRKLLSTFCVCTYVLLLGITTAAIYSVLVPISEDTGLTLAELNQGTGYMASNPLPHAELFPTLADFLKFLLFGWSCLFWQPIALQYGKRQVYLISLAGTLAMMVWQPHTKTSGQYLASKILQGFFGSPIESLAEISIADVYFQHERGRYFGIYALMLAGSNFLAPVLAGFITDGQGWQWVFYWCAIFVGVAFVILFFLMEETNWERQAPPSKSATSSVHPSYERPSSFQEQKPVADLRSEELQIDATRQRSSKTYFQKISLLPQKRPFRLWQMLFKPFLYFTLPAVAWSGFSYGSTLIWFNVLNGTASSFLSSPPYNFKPSIVGLTYISPLIGTLIASIYSGYIGDRFVIWKARRNSGLMEAEHRLWLFSLSAVATPFGLLLWGVGAAHHVHWFGLVFAMCILGVQSSAGVALSVAYALDSYRAISGQAMVTVILIRNTMSFAIGYGITPWVTNMGLQNAFIVAAFAGLVQSLSFLIFIKYGKRWRIASAERYSRYVEQERRLGLAH